MAGMAESIYDYDSITGSIREQFIEFPDVTYYEIGQVEAWEKTLSETDYYGNAFPVGLDEDKDGVFCGLS